MAQFDVVENTNAETRKTVPLLLDVQSDLLDSMATRIVIPLIDADQYGPPVARLNPVVEIDGAAFVLSTAEMAGVPASVLGRRVANLSRRRTEILAAIDILFSGV